MPLTLVADRGPWSSALVDAVGSADVAVESVVADRCRRVGAAVQHVVGESGLELAAVVGLDDFDAEREPRKEVSWNWMKGSWFIVGRSRGRMRSTSSIAGSSGLLAFLAALSIGVMDLTSNWARCPSRAFS